MDDLLNWDVLVTKRQGLTSEQIGEYVIDLYDVLFVSAEGSALLERMYRQGARLHASGCVMNSLVEEIKRNSKRR